MNTCRHSSSTTFTSNSAQNRASSINLSKAPKLYHVESRVQQRTKCILTGRNRGVVGGYTVARTQIKHFANTCQLFGVRKHSFSSSSKKVNSSTAVPHPCLRTTTLYNPVNSVTLKQLKQPTLKNLAVSTLILDSVNYRNPFFSTGLGCGGFIIAPNNSRIFVSKVRKGDRLKKYQYSKVSSSRSKQKIKIKKNKTPVFIRGWAGSNTDWTEECAVLKEIATRPTREEANPGANKPYDLVSIQPHVHTKLKAKQGPLYYLDPVYDRSNPTHTFHFIWVQQQEALRKQRSYEETIAVRSPEQYADQRNKLTEGYRASLVRFTYPAPDTLLFLWHTHTQLYRTAVGSFEDMSITNQIKLEMCVSERDQARAHNRSIDFFLKWSKEDLNRIKNRRNVPQETYNSYSRTYEAAKACQWLKHDISFKQACVDGQIQETAEQLAEWAQGGRPNGHGGIVMPQVALPANPQFAGCTIVNPSTFDEVAKPKFELNTGSGAFDYAPDDFSSFFRYLFAKLREWWSRRLDLFDAQIARSMKEMSGDLIVQYFFPALACWIDPGNQELLSIVPRLPSIYQVVWGLKLRFYRVYNYDHFMHRLVSKENNKKHWEDLRGDLRNSLLKDRPTISTCAYFALVLISFVAAKFF